MDGGLMAEKMMIGCVPCSDGTEQGYTPYENSTVERCVRCDVEVWVGPEQKRQQELCGYPIVCLRCVVKEYGPETMKRLQLLRKDG